jgi:hypothetical protein
MLVCYLLLVIDYILALEHYFDLFFSGAILLLNLDDFVAGAPARHPITG